jgi:hypothetical protein
MTKDIKDYIHFLHGYDVMTPYGVCKFLYYRCDLDPKKYNPVIVMRSDDMTFAFLLKEIQFIMRSIDDMTEEERKEYNHRKQRKGYMPEIHADNTFWLISRKFDVFGLIDVGIAIDKTKITTHDKH